MVNSFRGLKISTGLGLVAVLMASTACGKGGLGQGSKSGVNDSSNEISELSDELAVWECPTAFTLEVSDLRSKPLVSLQGNPIYERAVKGLIVWAGQTLELKMRLVEFSPKECVYAQGSSSNSAKATIRKQIVEQFGEDVERFTEETYLRFNFASIAGTSRYFGTFPIDTEEPQGGVAPGEGEGVALESSTTITGSSSNRTLSARVEGIDALKRIGSYDIALKN